MINGEPPTADRPRQPLKSQDAPWSAADIAAALQQAVAFHRQGKLADAGNLYRAILTKAPAHADALNLLGVVYYQGGQPTAAVELIERAIRLNPNNAAAYCNYGLALQALNRSAEALANYERALQLMPDYLEVHINRGTTLLALERYHDALASFARALQLKPDFPEALYNRGNALMKLKRPGDALAGYDRALRAKPDYAEAYSNRGTALLDLKRPDEALASYDRALQLQPDCAETYSNRGNALLELKRHEEAVASYDRALQLDPGYAEPYNNRGNALLDLRRYDEALSSFERAVQLKPDYAGAFYNCGNVLFELKRFGESAHAFARLIEIEPEHDYALGKMFFARVCGCDWSNYDAIADRIEAGVGRGEKTDLPFGFLAHSRDPAAQLQCARMYCADKHPAADRPVWTGRRYRHDKIRIAYLSADFHTHATAYLMTELFETHDRSCFEVSAVSFSPDDTGHMRDRVERSFDSFTDVRRMSDGDVARLLAEREIDIAVDLKGFTGDCRTGIFAYRGAPVQVSYLGYPGTMGADYVDYIIADPHVIPPGHESFYSEKIVRLPDTYQVNDRKRPIAGQTPSRAELGLPDRGFVFCCFNNNWKITPAIFDIWMRLLKQIEDSVLWLLEDNEQVSHTLRREVENRGVAASRIIFAPRMDLSEHLARHRQADLVLDTMPYNAHTTASDALWAGLPVVTCLGNTFASRVAGSLLHAAGLPELITHNPADYEALALKLATTPGILADIKAKLVRNRDTCTLFDTSRFRRHIEAAYITMVERHRRGKPPSGFDVTASP